MGPIQRLRLLQLACGACQSYRAKGSRTVSSRQRGPGRFHSPPRLPSNKGDAHPGLRGTAPTATPTKGSSRGQVGLGLCMEALGHPVHPVQRLLRPHPAQSRRRSHRGPLGAGRRRPVHPVSAAQESCPGRTAGRGVATSPGALRSPGAPQLSPSSLSRLGFKHLRWALTPASCCPAPREAAGDRASTRVPATHTGDADGPRPTPVDMCGVNQWPGHPSPSLSQPVPKVLPYPPPALSQVQVPPQAHAAHLTQLPQRNENSLKRNSRLGLAQAELAGQLCSPAAHARGGPHPASAAPQHL